MNREDMEFIATFCEVQEVGKELVKKCGNPIKIVSNEYSHLLEKDKKK